MSDSNFFLFFHSRLRRSLAILVLSCGSGAIYGQETPDCFDFTVGHGPFDYRTAPAKEKQVVEGAHFTRDVEALRRGSTGPVGGDIAYTLRAFPNHPRALYAMMKLGEKLKTERPRGSLFTVACYFARAVRWAPDDGSVRILYGIYLLRNGQRSAAVEQLKAAQELVGDNPNLHYNLGLAYFDLKDYDKALLHAKKAYELGFSLPGLRDKLKQVGKWTD